MKIKVTNYLFNTQTTDPVEYERYIVHRKTIYTGMYRTYSVYLRYCHVKLIKK